MEVAHLVVEYFANAIPPLAGLAMERIYQSVYCSIDQLRIGGSLNDRVSTCIIRRNGMLSAVLLFTQDGGTVRVLNETILIDGDVLRQFAHFVFGTLSASAISFHAIRADAAPLALPHVRIRHSEDIVVTLPDSTDGYLEMLGKATRKKLRQHIASLKRSFPTFRCDTYTADEPLEQHVRDIVGFHRTRFARLNKESAVDEAELDRLIALTRSRGSVTVIRINGRICAGAICTRAGANYFSHLVGHDPLYDRFRLGTVCCFMAIRHCIESGGREFHFLWGRYEYKYLLKGVERPLNDIMIYRTRTDWLLSLPIALRMVLRSQAAQVRHGAKATFRVVMKHIRAFTGHGLPRPARPSWKQQLPS